MYVLFSVILLFSFFQPVGVSSREAQPVDVTQYLEYLGAPYHNVYGEGPAIYARNIWDMQYYDGQLFLAAGNSSNKGPGQNAGPVPIISFSPTFRKFSVEGKVDDEQIETYTILDKELYIPGHDPTESWQYGNFYHRDNGSWVKSRNIQGALHVYNLSSHREYFYAGLGVKKGAAIAVSSDKGKKWSVISLGKGRVYTFLNIADKFYAVKQFPSVELLEKWSKRNRDFRFSAVSELGGSDNFLPRYDLARSTLFPDTKLDSEYSLKMVRVQTAKEKAYYIGAYSHNDHQNLPFGVYVASKIDVGNHQIKKIKLPATYMPWDLIIRDNYLYLLVQARPKTIVKVLRFSLDKEEVWDELFQFTSPTFARSFEEVNGDFYFGLGCDIKNPEKWKQEELHPATGTIYRVKKGDIAKLRQENSDSL